MSKQNKQIEQDILESLPHLEKRIFNLSINELVEMYKYLKDKLGEELWLSITFLNTN